MKRVFLFVGLLILIFALCSCNILQTKIFDANQEQEEEKKPEETKPFEILPAEDYNDQQDQKEENSKDPTAAEEQSGEEQTAVEPQTDTKTDGKSTGYSGSDRKSVV